MFVTFNSNRISFTSGNGTADHFGAVACPWSVVLSGYSASSTTKTGRHDIAESGVKTPTINQITISEHLIRSSPSVFSGAVLLNLCFSV